MTHKVGAKKMGEQKVHCIGGPEGEGLNERKEGERGRRENPINPALPPLPVNREMCSGHRKIRTWLKRRANTNECRLKTPL